MKVAALDLGSNSFLCLIAEVENGRITKVIEDKVEIVRLGEGLGGNFRRFNTEALARAKSCLENFSDLIDQYKPIKVLAMATAAARNVENADELISISQRLEIPIEVISGGREAEITYQGAVSGLLSESQSAGLLAVLDVGGGSTELILGNGPTLLFGRSFNFGCVKLTEKFLRQSPASDFDISRMCRFIDDEINEALPEIRRAGSPDKLVAVAGTPTELARVEIGGSFDAKKIDGFQFSTAQLKAWADKFKVETKDGVIQKYGINPGRADVILAGVCILERFCVALGKQHISVSTRGVRYGVALEIARREGEQK